MELGVQGDQVGYSSQNKTWDRREIHRESTQDICLKYFTEYWYSHAAKNHPKNFYPRPSKESTLTISVHLCSGDPTHCNKEKNLKERKGIISERKK